VVRATAHYFPLFMGQSLMSPHESPRVLMSTRPDPTHYPSKSHVTTTYILSELDVEKSITVRKDKLKDLRERAAKVDELEDEVANFERQKRNQDARLRKLEAFRETNAGNDRLAEDNARLKEELELHKNVSSRVAELEREQTSGRGATQKS
jgi:uncharacterized protein YbcC (UPF0753/DUF2309 family)